MNQKIWEQKQQIREFILRRGEFWITKYLSLYPMLAKNSRMELESEYQRMDIAAEHLTMTLRSQMAEGKLTVEERNIPYQSEFRVFRTWWDHLKYDLNAGRVMGWVPRWLILILKLQVDYSTIVRKSAVTVPVTVMNVCPHVDVNWHDRPEVHVQFLEGLKYP